jgi:hypothetical protein
MRNGRAISCQDEVDEIIRKHHAWLQGNGGECADFSDCTIENILFNGVFLNEATFAGAVIKNCEFVDVRMHSTAIHTAIVDTVHFRNSDLSYANFHDTYFTKTTFDSCRICKTVFSDAYFHSCNFSDTVGEPILTDAGVDSSTIPFVPSVCPTDGAFIGWKKSKNGSIIKLLVPEDAKRCSGTSRKCRCDRAIVLEFQELDGTPITDIPRLASWYEPSFIYEVGKEIRSYDAMRSDEYGFDEDRFRTCSSGIHFFIDRQEAVNFALP